MIPVSQVKTYVPELVQGKVMVVSNEDQDIMVGKIVGFMEVSLAKQRMPIVRCDDGHECFGGVILPYDESFKTLLESKPYKERFQFLSNIFWLRNELQQIERIK